MISTPSSNPVRLVYLKLIVARWRNFDWNPAQNHLYIDDGRVKRTCLVEDVGIAVYCIQEQRACFHRWGITACRSSVLPVARKEGMWLRELVVESAQYILVYYDQPFSHRFSYSMPSSTSFRRLQFLMSPCLAANYLATINGNELLREQASKWRNGNSKH